MEKGEEGGENMYTKVNCIDCAHFEGCRRTYASATSGDWAYADFEKMRCTTARLLCLKLNGCIFHAK